MKKIFNKMESMESQKSPVGLSMTSVELLISSLAHDERTKWILEDYTWKAILKSALLDEKNDKIDFAKSHVEAALKAASENAKVVDVGIDYSIIEWTVEKSSILNSYPLDKIK
jgi:hypothetical protein